MKAKLIFSKTNEPLLIDVESTSFAVDDLIYNGEIGTIVELDVPFQIGHRVKFENGEEVCCKVFNKILMRGDKLMTEGIELCVQEDLPKFIDLVETNNRNIFKRLKENFTYKNESITAEILNTIFNKIRLSKIFYYTNFSITEYQIYFDLPEKDCYIMLTSVKPETMDGYEWRIKVKWVGEQLFEILKSTGITIDRYRN